MPKKTDERLEELRIVLETLEMMIRLIKDLGFEPSPKISQFQGASREKAATLYSEKLNDIYQGYATMLEDREKLKVKIGTLAAQKAELLCAAEKKSSVKEQSDPQQKKASNRRAKRKADPWSRPKRRRQQPNIKEEKISKSPLSSEII